MLYYAPQMYLDVKHTQTNTQHTLSTQVVLSLHLAALFLFFFVFLNSSSSIVSNYVCY